MISRRGLLGVLATTAVQSASAASAEQPRGGLEICVGIDGGGLDDRLGLAVLDRHANLRSGITTLNEVRAAEGLPPIDFTSLATSASRFR